LAAHVRRQFRVNLDMDDLVAFGNVGLLEAADRFDASFGNNFLTFAHYRIKGAIYDGLRKMGILRGSDSAQATFGGGANAFMANAADRGGSHGMGGFDDAVAEVTDAVTGLAAICAAVMGSDGELGESAEEHMEREELRGKILAAMQLLPDKERQLIETYYFKGKTLEEAGSLLGQSKSWSSRLHARAIVRLQEILSEEVSGVAKPQPVPKRTGMGQTPSPVSANRTPRPPEPLRRAQGRALEETAEQMPSDLTEEVTNVDAVDRPSASSETVEQDNPSAKRFGR
jgi:RNA polymerase sigma factor for flagellar operon FliA